MADVGEGSHAGRGRDAGAPGDDADRAPLPRGGETSPWHWAAVVLGALIVLATMGFLVWDGMQRREHPLPQITLAVDTVVAVPGGFAVHVRARNDGGHTATEVRVRGELALREAPLERAETSIDYLPPGSIRRGGLVFSRDPRVGRLELRVVGYSLP
jgi:uncharacterized protein (TIGR02588 family)